MLLIGARHEPRNVDERDERDVECITRAHEPGRLLRGIDVQHACEHCWLVPHEAHDASLDAGEPTGDVHRPVWVHLEVLALVHHRRDHLLHVIGLVGR